MEPVCLSVFIYLLNYLCIHPSICKFHFIYYLDLLYGFIYLSMYFVLCTCQSVWLLFLVNFFICLFVCSCFPLLNRIKRLNLTFNEHKHIFYQSQLVTCTSPDSKVEGERQLYAREHTKLHISPSRGSRTRARSPAISLTLPVQHGGIHGIPGCL